MYLSARGIFIAIVSGIAALALLRFRPWKTQAPTQLAGAVHEGPNDDARQSLTIGYLPVTCHLTCPVTDYSSKTTRTATNFNSKRFTDFPTVVSALEARQVQATFMIVPLAMKLKEQGVPVKICYLGHREGSQIVVAKKSPAKSLKDLKGKKIAIPSLYSNQHLVLNKLMADQGMAAGDLNFVVLPPPDMPTSLAAGAIDAYFVGEPFCAKSELDGIGRILYYARDIWPNFISCALVVHEDLINSQPDVVRDLVRGIAESGVWAEKNRAAAAKVAAPYFRQDPKVLNYVLTGDPRRVSYVGLQPSDEELQRIGDMAVDMGLLKNRVAVNDLVRKDFIPATIRERNLAVH